MLRRLLPQFPTRKPTMLGRWCTGSRNWETKVDNENGDHGWTPSPGGSRRAKVMTKIEDEDGPWSRPTLATVMGL